MLWGTRSDAYDKKNLEIRVHEKFLELRMIEIREMNCQRDDRCWVVSVMVSLDNFSSIEESMSRKL